MFPLRRAHLTILILFIFCGSFIPHASLRAAGLRPVVGDQAMVVSAHPLATTIGREVLQSGGNAVDAAVAVGFALAVVYPYAGNLGGGGFLLMKAPGQGPVSLDFREEAPRAATADLYLDESGNPIPGLSSTGALSAGVPGTVAGLLEAHKTWGKLPLKQLLKPCIQLAKDGFAVDRKLAHELQTYEKHLSQFKGTADLYYPNGAPLKYGQLFKQPDLAKVLKAIAKSGRSGFYEGEVADLIVAQMERAGGIITHDDLRAYRPIIRKPIEGDYQGYRIISMPPPSSGGIHLIQMLNMLEPYPLAYMGHNSAETMHIMAETMRRAYADRSLHLGDPAFYEVPAEGLISSGYADYLRSTIDRHRATPSAQVSPGNPALRGPQRRGYVQPAYLKEGQDTTHYSIQDADGMAVSITYTINFPYGSAMVVEGAGFLLNNEMDDFSMKPGVPNAYGLMGSQANAIAPGKRPLSSMTPTIITQDDRTVLITGSPGGSRIITSTLQVILNHLTFKLPPGECVAAPRFHHQWLPDVLEVERGFSVDTLDRLGERGHATRLRAEMGSTNTIIIDGDTLYGIADPRRIGTAEGY